MDSIGDKIPFGRPVRKFQQFAAPGARHSPHDALDSPKDRAGAALRQCRRTQDLRVPRLRAPERRVQDRRAPLRQ